MSYLFRWTVFVWERFNPIAYITMIGVFVGAHISWYLNSSEQILDDLGLRIIPISFLALIFFLKLRLFDEVKDHEVDKKIHPERPLPRGLLNVKDVKKVVLVLIVLELALFVLYGVWTFLSGLLAIGYSLMMYKEFFVRDWIRTKLFLYAITHTFVIVLLSLAIYVSFSQKSLLEIPRDFLLFSIGGWFIFTIFEFGRKTFARQEERNEVDSYSKLYGRLGAVSLVWFAATVGTILIIQSVALSNHIFFLFSGLLLFVSGLLYILLDSILVSKIYRLTTAAYIPLVYGSITLLL